MIGKRFRASSFIFFYFPANYNFTLWSERHRKKGSKLKLAEIHWFENSLIVEKNRNLCILNKEIRIHNQVRYEEEKKHGSARYFKCWKNTEGK